MVHLPLEMGSRYLGAGRGWFAVASPLPPVAGAGTGGELTGVRCWIGVIDPGQASGELVALLFADSPELIARIEAALR